VSNTRRVIDWITEAAAPCKCLETNIYSLPSSGKSNLARDSHNIAPLKFLLERIKPSVIVGHGEDAVREIQRLAPASFVRGVNHFSRGWSKEEARALGEEVKARVHAD